MNYLKSLFHNWINNSRKLFVSIIVISIVGFFIYAALGPGCALTKDGSPPSDTDEQIAAKIVTAIVEVIILLRIIYLLIRKVVKK
jgi:hypothetical protein